MTSLGKDSSGRIVQTMRPGIVHNVIIDGIARETIVAFKSTVVRLCASVGCHYAVAQGGVTATVLDTYLPADTIERISVRPGDRLGVIEAVGSGSAGMMHITEAA